MTMEPPGFFDSPADEVAVDGVLEFSFGHTEGHFDTGLTFGQDAVIAAERVHKKAIAASKKGRDGFSMFQSPGAGEGIFKHSRGCRQALLRVLFVGNRQFVAALSTATSQNFTSVFRTHTRAKTVFVGTFSFRGLVSSFHD
jgi:hypothetical protein